MSTPFKANDLILFTGDSITDGGRNRNNAQSLGDGYVNRVAERLCLDHPELNLRFQNAGIGGDRTCDLLARWTTDCIDLQPDWVSILVGINNTWRRYDSNDPTPAMPRQWHIYMKVAECKKITKLFERPKGKKMQNK